MSTQHTSSERTQKFSVNEILKQIQQEQLEQLKHTKPSSASADVTTQIPATNNATKPEDSSQAHTKKAPEAKTEAQPQAKPQATATKSARTSEQVDKGTAANAQPNTQASTQPNTKPNTNPNEQAPASFNAALTNPKADLEALDTLERTLAAWRYAAAEIGGLGMSIDPEGASTVRGDVLASFEQQRRELLLNPSTTALLDRLSCPSAVLTEQATMQVRVLKQDIKKIAGVPVSLASAYQKLLCDADAVWHRAKAQNNWGAFSGYLEQIIARMKEIAHAKNPDADPYDVWLSEFEDGLNQAYLDDMFEQITACTTPLIAQIERKKQRGFTVTHDMFSGKFDEQRQWQLARDLLKLEGLDLSRVLLIPTEHPYSEAPSCSWGIIASHVYEHDILSNVFSMFHEGGHTLYELGVKDDYERTSLKGGTSFGMHEAQSRFFENYIARDRAYIPHILACMTKHFQGQLGRVTPNQLWRAANEVHPEAVRCDADELTYSVHIMIRYQLEKRLFNGSLKVEDVPDAWNSLTRELLGVDVPDNAHGCLQDMHWSSGYIGYFASYAYGNVIGAQLRHQMMEDGLLWDTILASGDIHPIRQWLKTNIWQYGRLKTTIELMQAACHEPIRTEYYLDYLQKKFTSLYNL